MTRSASGKVAPEHVILFLAANPSDTGRLALDREARAILREMAHSGDRDRFDFQTRWAAEPLDLLRELRALRPIVVHFSGHGAPPLAADARSEPGGLMFGSETGASRMVTPEAIAQTFGAVDSAVRLVVLNACYTAPIAEALLAHVDCVVGMTGAMHEDAARSFAIGFYGGLCEHQSITAAFAQGKAAIRLDGLPDADPPQLRVRDGFDAAEVILGSPAAGATGRASAAAAAEVEAGASIRRSRSRWSWIAAVVGTAVLAAVAYKLTRQDHDAQYRSAIDEAEKAVSKMCACPDLTCINPSISSMGIDLGFLETKYKALSKSDFKDIYAAIQTTMDACIRRVSDATKADVEEVTRQLKDVLGGAAASAGLPAGTHDDCARIAQNLARFRADHARAIHSIHGFFVVKADATFTPENAARSLLDGYPSCKEDPGVLRELTAVFSDIAP